MTPPANTKRCKNHRLPGEIISHGVWLYSRFPSSHRDVQEMLFERGIDVTYEAIRQWCCKFGQNYVHTDKLKSYGAAKREILPGVAPRQSRYLNNRCENSHRPTRQRARRMQGFTSPGHVQRFSLHMASSPNTPARDGICCPRRRTARRWEIDARVGARLRARSGLPKGWVGPGRAIRLLDKLLRLNNLTKPLRRMSTTSVLPNGPLPWEVEALRGQGTSPKLHPMTL